MELKAAALYLKQLKEGLKPHKKVDDADVADYLETVRRSDEGKFRDYLLTLPAPIRAQTFVELPTTLQVDLIEDLPNEQLAEIANALESDDATDLVKLIGEVDDAKKQSVFDLIDGDRQQKVEVLLGYDEHEAGSLMQTELFKARSTDTIAAAIEALRALKEAHHATTFSFVFVVDEENHLLRVVPFDEMILCDRETQFAAMPPSDREPAVVQSRESVDSAIEAIQKYDLGVLPVVDKLGRLLGRITHDDAIDWVQKKATEQMYKLAQVGSQEELQNGASATKWRTFWLAINLISVTFVSMVVGLFDKALSQFVALAILMPIISNIAGSAAVQTITVAIRQIALGELKGAAIAPFVRREVIIGAFNGIVLGIATGAISYWRFGNADIAWIIGSALLFSMVMAGFNGSVTPLVFKKLGFDPAVSSSVLIGTFMDMLSFFAFLGLASMILL